MTAPIRRPSVVSAVGENRRRIEILEAAYPVGSAMWPMPPWNVMPNNDVYFNNTDSFAGATTWQLVADAAGAPQYGTWYWEADDVDAYLIRGFRLGPTGSEFGLAVIADQGPDFGKLTVDWATGSDNSSGVYGLPDQIGFMETPYMQSYANFYDTGHNATIDGYAAAPSVATLATYEWNPFRIMGADGTPLTAAGTYDGTYGLGEVTSGPGIYWLRIRTHTKHASSSGYKARIRQLHLYRRSADGYLV